MNIKRLIAVVILFFPLLSFAGKASDELSVLLTKIHSMQANFNQKIYDAHGIVLQESRGRMALKRPGKFLWETQGRDRQLIIANNEDLWVYDVALEQATVQNLQQTSGNAPAVLLTGPVSNLFNNFKVMVPPTQQKDSPWYRLVPKNKKENELFSWIELNFVRGDLKKMRFRDDLHHTTELEFTQIKLNQPLGDAQFVFQPPPGVDVIRNVGRRSR